MGSAPAITTSRIALAGDRARACPIHSVPDSTLACCCCADESRTEKERKTQKEVPWADFSKGNTAMVATIGPGEVLADSVADGNVPGVVALAAHEDQLIYAGAFGEREINSGVEMTL